MDVEVRGLDVDGNRRAELNVGPRRIASRAFAQAFNERLHFGALSLGKSPQVEHERIGRGNGDRTVEREDDRTCWRGGFFHARAGHAEASRLNDLLQNRDHTFGALGMGVSVILLPQHRVVKVPQPDLLLRLLLLYLLLLLRLLLLLLLLLFLLREELAQVIEQIPPHVSGPIPDPRLQNRSNDGSGERRFLLLLLLLHLLRVLEPWSQHGAQQFDERRQSSASQVGGVRLLAGPLESMRRVRGHGECTAILSSVEYRRQGTDGYRLV